MADLEIKNLQVTNSQLENKSTEEADQDQKFVNIYGKVSQLKLSQIKILQDTSLDKMSFINIKPDSGNPSVEIDQLQISKTSLTNEGHIINLDASAKL